MARCRGSEKGARRRGRRRTSYWGSQERVYPGEMGALAVGGAGELRNRANRQNREEADRWAHATRGQAAGRLPAASRPRRRPAAAAVERAGVLCRLNWRSAIKGARSWRVRANVVGAPKNGRQKNYIGNQASRGAGRAPPPGPAYRHGVYITYYRRPPATPAPAAVARGEAAGAGPWRAARSKCSSCAERRRVCKAANAALRWARGRSAGAHRQPRAAAARLRAQHGAVRGAPLLLLPRRLVPPQLPQLPARQAAGGRAGWSQ